MKRQVRWLWCLFAAAVIVILIAVWGWAELACHTPAWQTVLSGAPSCTEFWLNRYQGLIGALATLFAGFLAYRAALSEAKRAERQARQAEIAALKEQAHRLYREIDTLRLASGYIGKYLDRFPVWSQERPDKTLYFNIFRLARTMAQDFVSASALSAPDGYGTRIHTLMTAIQQLGDRIEENILQMGGKSQAAINLFGDEIVDRVTGLHAIRAQIQADIPGYEARLNGLRDTLAGLEKSH